jgi:hypothetical protein
MGDDQCKSLAEYLELKRKLTEVRAHLSKSRTANDMQIPSVKADLVIIVAFLESIERNTVNEIELYELTHEPTETELQDQINHRDKWIQVWTGNPTVSVVRSRARFVSERNELRIKLERLRQRKAELQERISRFRREEVPELRKANKHTKHRIAEVLKKLQTVNSVGESRDGSSREESTGHTKGDSGTEPSFIHSPDYQDIQFNGEAFRATPRQAEIIRVLDEARQRGQNQVSTQQIKKATQCGKISDSFRAGHGPRLWNVVVMAMKGAKGMYRLNLPRSEE